MIVSDEKILQGVLGPDLYAWSHGDKGPDAQSVVVTFTSTRTLDEARVRGFRPTATVARASEERSWRIVGMIDRGRVQLLARYPGVRRIALPRVA